MSCKIFFPRILNDIEKWLWENCKFQKPDTELYIQCNLSSISKSMCVCIYVCASKEKKIEDRNLLAWQLQPGCRFWGDFHFLKNILQTFRVQILIIIKDMVFRGHFKSKQIITNNHDIVS